mmetsp:Transcript_5231/g.14808  ORF Transcript_5231/g.14808 Transcript_5231/m.14808 type:complete len:212 (+) Transcript_5231:424-1059(+)
MVVAATASTSARASALLSVQISRRSAMTQIVDRIVPRAEQRASSCRTPLWRACESLNLKIVKPQNTTVDVEARSKPHVTATSADSASASKSGAANLTMENVRRNTAETTNVVPIPMELFLSLAAARIADLMARSSSDMPQRDFAGLNRQSTRTEEIPSRKASAPMPTRESVDSSKPMPKPKMAIMREATTDIKDTFCACRTRACSARSCPQ